MGSIIDSVPLQDEAAVRRDFPGIREGAVRRSVGAAGLLISMTERQLHSQGGVEKGKLRLLQTPIGCGQDLTGVATCGNAQEGGRQGGEDKCRMPSPTRSLRSLASGGEKFPRLGIHKSNGLHDRIKIIKSTDAPALQGVQGVRRMQV